MERICYNPTKKTLPEAKKLAEPWGIRVQTGNSELTSNLDFDRTKVQILQVPVEQYFKMSDTEISVNNVIRAEYLDEFSDTSSVKLEYEGSGIRETVQALPSGNPHYKSFRFRIGYTGEYEIRITDKNGIIATGQLTVTP
jgi:hypothetical protein